MHAGIAGAGLLGRLLAYRLLQAGWQVTLYDQDKYLGQQSCGLSAAAMLSPYAELETADVELFNMGLKSLTHWQRYLSDLNASELLHQTGCLFISHQQDSSDFQRVLNLIKHKLLDSQCQANFNISVIQDYEPEIKLPGNHASFFPEEAFIDNVELFTLLGKFLFNHVENWYEECTVEHVEAQGIHALGKLQKFDCVFDCRGLGAGSNFKNLRGVRGELIRLHAPDVNIKHVIRLMHPRYRLYIVPKSSQHYWIGASEIESDDQSAISLRSCLELMSAAYSIHPGFAEARVLETIVNCRPALPDNLPLIKYTEGMIAVNGLYRHGYLLAPALVEDVLQYLEHGIDAVHYKSYWQT